MQSRSRCHRFCNSELPGTPVQRTTIYDAYRDADSECRAQVRDEYVLAVVFFCNQTLTSCINKAYPDSASPSTPSDLIGSFLASTDNTSEANHTPAGISDEVLKKKCYHSCWASLVYIYIFQVYVRRFHSGTGRGWSGFLFF